MQVQNPFYLLHKLTLWAVSHASWWYQYHYDVTPVRQAIVSMVAGAIIINVGVAMIDIHLVWLSGVIISFHFFCKKTWNKPTNKIPLMATKTPYRLSGRLLLHCTVYYWYCLQCVCWPQESRVGQVPTWCLVCMECS